MVRDRRQTLSGIDAETMRPRVCFHGSGNRHEQKQKCEEKIGNSENGNGKAENRTNVCITKPAISMQTCRSRMSDASQGAFVVIPEISHSDISYIHKKLLLHTCETRV